MPLRPPRPRVLEMDTTVSIEHGVVPPPDVPLQRAAVLAHFSVDPVVGRSFRELIRELHRHGYLIVVVSTSVAPGPLDFRGELPHSAVVLRRSNVGYDFGSWAVGLSLVPAVRGAEHTILANDSMVGPFASLGSILGQFEASSADVFGLTDTYQYSHHLQSYFVGYRRGVLNERVLRRFWDGIRHEDEKIDIILKNEVGLSRVLRAESFVTDVAFRSDAIVPHGENPVIRGWRRLLEQGFPFVKREIVRYPDVAPDGERVPAVLRAAFGEDVADWL
jgi:lipopolysaccharide biosynthesis protein